MASLALLGGCGQGAYPSLAVRPAERITRSMTPMPGPSPAATPLALTPLAGAALASRLGELLNAARAGHKLFLTQQEGASALVLAATAAPVAGEAWSAAQQAVSRLSAVRANTAIALAQILRIDAEDRVSHALADGNADGADTTGARLRPDSAAISAALGEISAMADEEDTTLASLRARLPG